MQVFLIGGSVRDRLLQRPEKDKDFVVLQATEEEFLARFPRAKKVGKGKAVFLLGRDEYTLSASASIEEELGKRDLTINALALDQKNKLYAHPLALKDLENKLLRPIEKKNFFQDPLRVYRSARFWSELPEFKLHSTLLYISWSVLKSEKIKTLSAERVWGELFKALQAKKPGNFFRFLNLISGFNFWFAQLQESAFIPAGPKHHHPESVLEHTLNLMDALAPDFWGAWLAFCHDLGKVLTPVELLPHHYGHEEKGRAVLKDLAKKLPLPRKMLKYGAIACRYHMLAGKYTSLRPGTRVKLLLSLPQEIFEPFFKLVRLDQGMDYLEQALQDLKVIQKVKLPPAHQNLGSRSGAILHSLRAKALKDFS